MKIIDPGFEILSHVDRKAVLKQLERIGRTCYKSEAKITNDSASAFVRKLIANGHEAMIEHFSITVKIICDRGISHEIVRHRVGASYAQESTRYCNYGTDGECTFIQPILNTHADLDLWGYAMSDAEDYYLKMIKNGASPQQARSVLPNSLKTEIVVTMTLRAWRHFFKLRALGMYGEPHPQMKQIAVPLLEEFINLLPEVFDDLAV